MKLDKAFFDQRVRISQIEQAMLEAIPHDSYTIEIVIAIQHIQTKLLSDLMKGEDEPEET